MKQSTTERFYFRSVTVADLLCANDLKSNFARQGVIERNKYISTLPKKREDF